MRNINSEIKIFYSKYNIIKLKLKKKIFFRKHKFNNKKNS